MKKNIVLLIVSFAMLMESVDTTIINTAIPVIAYSLHTSPINLKLALISYLLSLAIFIPISGWIADKYGLKKVFIGAVGLFILSSFCCGFAHNIYELVFSRIIQGFGGSLTLPLGRLIILRTSKRDELISKMSIVVMIASLGMMLGPLLGGFITHRFSWPWIFWVNVPIGLVTIILALKFMPQMKPKSVPPLDKKGFLLFGAGLSSLTLGLSVISEAEVLASLAFFLLLLAGVFLFLYTKHSQNKAHPVVKIDLLHQRTFRISVTGNLLARLGFGGIPFLIPLLLQIGLGFSPELSGLLLAPTALGVFLVKPFALHIIRFLGYKRLLLLNTFFVSLSIIFMATINQYTSFYSISLLTFIYGFFISLQYSSMTSLAYANIGPDDLSAASSIMSTIQQVAQSFGVAASAILLRIFSIHHNITITTFRETFIAIAVVTLLSVSIFIQLKREDGNELVQMKKTD